MFQGSRKIGLEDCVLRFDDCFRFTLSHSVIFCIVVPVLSYICFCRVLSKNWPGLKLASLAHQ